MFLLLIKKKKTILDDIVDSCIKPWAPQLPTNNTTIDIPGQSDQVGLCTFILSFYI